MAALADAYFTAVQTEGTPNYKPVPLALDAHNANHYIFNSNRREVIAEMNAFLARLP